MKTPSLLFCICLFFISNAQDSLSIEVLKPLSYTFTIEDGTLKGAGADFLKKEVAKAQFTLLGEYYESTNISNFTSALLPELDKHGYKTMVLDVGTVSEKILTRLSKKTENLTEEIKNFNQKYAFQEKGNTHIPMLDFKHQEEAKFLEKAFQQNWSLIGIGRESWNGLQVLLDQLYENLSSEKQQAYKKSYQTSRDSLMHFYAERNGDYKQFSLSLKDCKPIHQFLKEAASQEENHSIIEAFQHSIHLVEYYAEKAFYEENDLRIKKEKQLLRKGLEQRDFDPSKDKLLIKMGFEYLAKGFQFYAYYGIGNTIQEMATYHGNQSLHIGFAKRYYTEGEVLNDVLEGENSRVKRIKNFLQLGQKEEWIIIDLRPLVKGSYYWPLKYLLTKEEDNLIQKYDLLIIPKTDITPTINY